jgi:hypothetical protein
MKNISLKNRKTIPLSAPAAERPTATAVRAQKAGKTQFTPSCNALHGITGWPKQNFTHHHLT